MYRIGAISGVFAAGILCSKFPSAPTYMDEQVLSKKNETMATSAITHNPGKAAQLTSPKETHINVEKPFYTFDEAADEVTLDPAQYKRIDKELMQLSKFKAFASGNALHETLFGFHRLEKYRIYKKLGADEIVAVVRFG